MRVGIDVGRALHGRGGVAIYTREMIRALAELEIEGRAEHRIICLDLDHGVTRREALESVMGPLPESFEIAAPKRQNLRRLHLLHAPGFVVPRHETPRMVFTIHDLTILSLPSCHTLENRVRTLSSVVEAVCQAALLTTPSRAARDEVVRLLDIPRDEIEVFHPLLDPIFEERCSREQDREILAGRRLPSRYLLAVGSLEPRKNFPRLLAAWQELPPASRLGIRLVVLAIAGWREAAIRTQLEELIEEGSLVLLEEPLPSRQLAALYRGAEALVFPSLAEGFGLPVSEAMACGTPVITSNTSSMPEVAGDAALLIDPEDPSSIAEAMQRVMQDSDLCRRMSAAGIERARLFSRKVGLPRLLEIYDRALSI